MPKGDWPRRMLLVGVGVLVVVSWSVVWGSSSPEVVQEQVHFAPPAHVNVWASGGLGNRLSSVLNGLWLAHALQRHLVVHWPVDDACQAPFAELFTLNPDASPRITVTPHPPDPSTFHITLLTPRLHTTTTSTSALYPTTEIALPGWGQVDEYIGSVRVRRVVSGWARNTSLGLGSPFVRSIRELFAGRNSAATLLYANDHVAQGIDMRHLGALLAQAVTVVPRVIIMATDFTAQHLWNPRGHLTSMPVGVHLRGTDAARDVDIPAMARDVRKRFPGRRYFTCGDSEALEEEFAAAVDSPGQVLRRQKHALPVKRDASLPFRVKENHVRVLSNIVRSSDSVVEAFADLLLLSRTELPSPRLKGSVVSSFIDIAAALQKMEFSPFSTAPQGSS